MASTKAPEMTSADARRERRKHEIHQHEVARELGMSRPRYTRWENGADDELPARLSVGDVFDAIARIVARQGGDRG